MISRRAAAQALLRACRHRVSQLIDDAPRELVQRTALRVAVVELAEASGLDSLQARKDAVTGAIQGLLLYHMRAKSPQANFQHDVQEALDRAFKASVTMQALLTSATIPKMDGRYSLTEMMELAGVEPETVEEEKKANTE